jgi:hypothetical protein
MSTTGVNIGWGAKIRIGRGVTPTWTEIVGIGDFDFPQMAADDVEVTSHSSPNRTKEYIQGLIDNGEMPVPLDYIPNSDQDLLLRFLQQTGETIQIGITPAGVLTEEVYAGYVKTYTRSAPVNGKSSANLIFRINGIVSGEAVDPDLP